MAEADGIRVPRSEAEATRRRLLELGVLRIDLEVAKDGDHIVFPVADSCGPRLPLVRWTFAERAVRPGSYQDLLPPGLRAAAPRAFDQVGDLIAVRIPPGMEPHARSIGEALLAFHRNVRAVFEDRGVRDPFRTRDLALIAGQGGTLTKVSENGIQLWVDPAQAYYSPRLAAERERLTALVKPEEHVVDLFAGVAPFAIPAARRGAVVDAVDLNPAAIQLARRNVDLNGVADKVTLHEGDARLVAPRLAKADRIVMNLPHAAKQFLDVAAALARPGSGAVIHHHEILAPEHFEARKTSLATELAGFGRGVASVTVRTVRNYSPQDVHAAFDITLER